MDDDITEYPTRRLRLYPCQSCGRQFNVESLNKHQAICRKVSTTRRKVFDAGKQRATDSDVPYKATKKTAQIYRGEVSAKEDRVKSIHGWKIRSKSTWREKHRSLIQKIREARSVTQAIQQGGPLPAFRPSDVPSDYVTCPHCRRNFNAHAAKRHIPFCQAQQERRHPQPTRSHHQLNQGRSLPPPPQQPSYSTYTTAQIAPRSNGSQHRNSAPMVARRDRSDNPHGSFPSHPPVTADEQSFRRLFGLSSSYASDAQYEYERPVRRPAQQPMIMRTGRSQENTNLNGLARQRNDHGSTYARRLPAVAVHTPPSFSQPRYPSDQEQYQSIRTRTIGRPPPSNTFRCADCGSISNNVSSHYCGQCGSRR